MSECCCSDRLHLPHYMNSAARQGSSTGENTFVPFVHNKTCTATGAESVTVAVTGGQAQRCVGIQAFNRSTATPNVTVYKQEPTDVSPVALTSTEAQSGTDNGQTYFKLDDAATTWAPGTIITVAFSGAGSLEVTLWTVPYQAII